MTIDYLSLNSKKPIGQARIMILKNYRAFGNTVVHLKPLHDVASKLSVAIVWKTIIFRWEIANSKAAIQPIENGSTEQISFEYCT